MYRRSGRKCPRARVADYLQRSTGRNGPKGKFDASFRNTRTRSAGRRTLKDRVAAGGGQRRRRSRRAAIAVGCETRGEARGRSEIRQCPRLSLGFALRFDVVRQDDYGERESARRGGEKEQ